MFETGTPLGPVRKHRRVAACAGSGGRLVVTAPAAAAVPDPVVSERGPRVPRPSPRPSPTRPSTPPCHRDPAGTRLGSSGCRLHLRRIITTACVLSSHSYFTRSTRSRASLSAPQSLCCRRRPGRLRPAHQRLRRQGHLLQEVYRTGRARRRGGVDCDAPDLASAEGMHWQPYLDVIRVSAFPGRVSLTDGCDLVQQGRVRPSSGQSTAAAQQQHIGGAVRRRGRGQPDGRRRTYVARNARHRDRRSRWRRTQRHWRELPYRCSTVTLLVLVRALHLSGRQQRLRSVNENSPCGPLPAPTGPRWREPRSAVCR